MLHDGAQIAGLQVDAKLALGAGALVENGVHVLDGAAAAEVVDHVVDEGEQLDGKVAHRHFGFLAEIDELAFDAVASGAPLVFFDEGAAVNAKAHVGGVEAMELDDDGLCQCGDGNSLLYLGGDIAHAELKGAERGVRADVPPDFLAAVDAVELDEEAEEIFVGAPGFELLGDASAREAAKDGGAEGFQAGVAAHPERRAGGEREEVGKEVAHHVHHVDRGLLVGHGDVDVHAEDQERARELLQFLDDVLVAFAGGDDLIDPTGEGVRAGGGDLQAGALGGGDQFAARAVHFDAQLTDVFANLRAGLDDGLVHLVLDLLDDIRRSGGDELHDMRAELTCGGVDDLKFFFYADGKAVSHGVALRILGLRGQPSAYHTPLVVKIALLQCMASGHIRVGRSGLDLASIIRARYREMLFVQPQSKEKRKRTQPVDLAAPRSTYK